MSDRRVLQSALEGALCAQVEALFKVLVSGMVQGDAGALERFNNGLQLTREAYHSVQQTIEKQRP